MNSPQEVPDNDKLNIPMPKINGKVNFENVSFSFLDKGPLILSKINLNIDKGKFVAIVGESGSGKSTLSKLIARLYEPNDGMISIDNIFSTHHKHWGCEVFIQTGNAIFFH